MTPTHKERLLADILAALLRIEALMQRERVTDPRPAQTWTGIPAEAVLKVLGDPRECVTIKTRPEGWTYWAADGSPSAPLPGMPDPPIAPVRPQTTWDSRTTCGSNYPEIPDSSIAPVRPQTVWSSLPTSCADKATGPSLNQGRYMHGGWIHATGFSMVGP